MSIVTTERLAALAEQITAKAAEAVTGSTIAFGELNIEARADQIVPLLTLLKDDADFQFQQLIELCGVDYPERPLRFDVVYHLLSLTKNVRLRVKVQTDEDTAVPSVTGVYPNADWCERETFDMYGVFFSGHPDLRRILTDYGFHGHPLRKDFPMTGYVEVRYDDKGRRSLVPTGEVAEFPCDAVLIAIGQENAFPWIERDIGVEFGKWDVPVVDPVTFQSTLPVYVSATLTQTGRVMVKDSVVLLRQHLAQAVDAAIEERLDAHVEDVACFLVEHAGRQAKHGNLAAHHAASLRLIVEDIDLVAEWHQVPGDGERGRPSTDQRDVLAVLAPGNLGHELDDAALVVSGGALQATDGHRIALDTPTPAGRLARAVAGAPQDAGEDIRLPVDHVGVGVAFGGDHADVLRHGRVRGAGVLAIDDLVEILGITDVGGLHAVLAPCDEGSGSDRFATRAGP